MPGSGSESERPFWGASSTGQSNPGDDREVVRSALRSERVVRGDIHQSHTVGVDPVEGQNRVAAGQEQARMAAAAAGQVEHGLALGQPRGPAPQPGRGRGGGAVAVVFPPRAAQPEVSCQGFMESPFLDRDWCSIGDLGRRAMDKR